MFCSVWLVTVLYPNCIGILSFCKMGTHGLSSYIADTYGIGEGIYYNEGNTVQLCYKTVYHEQLNISSRAAPVSIQDKSGHTVRYVLWR